MTECRHCGEEIENYGDRFWVTVTPGGSYDFCPAAPGPDWDLEKKHHPTRKD